MLQAVSHASQPPPKPPKQIGLTGNIGSGKSTVAAMLEAKGAAIIDADALAREASRDPLVLEAIAAQLGDSLVSAGQLDRAATAALVFDNPQARQTLNSIMHPWVARERRQRSLALEQHSSPPPLIVHDIPLLYENGLEQDLDAVIVVNASLATRIRRVQARSALSAEDIRARDAAQMPLEQKCARADYVIDNDHDAPSPEARHAWLEPQLQRLWQQLTKLTKT